MTVNELMTSTLEEILMMMAETGNSHMEAVLSKPDESGIKIEISFEEVEND